MNRYNDGVEITVIEEEEEVKNTKTSDNNNFDTNKPSDDNLLAGILNTDVPRPTQIRLPDNLQYDKDKKPLTCHRCKWTPKYLNKEGKLVCELHSDENCRDFHDDPLMELSYKYITMKKYQTLFRYYPKLVSKEEQQTILSAFDPDR